MSICQEGLESKVQSEKIEVFVSEKHPLIRLVNKFRF